MGNVNDRGRDECLTVYYCGDVARKLRSRGFMSATLGCNNVLKPTGRFVTSIQIYIQTKENVILGSFIQRKPRRRKKKKKRKNFTEQADGETARVRPLGEKCDSARDESHIQILFMQSPVYRPIFCKLMIAVQHFDPCADAEMALSVCTETVHDGGL